jgi:hypothetical protein
LSSWRQGNCDGDHDQGNEAPAVSGSSLNIRDVEFGSPEVYLAADYSLEALVRACKEEPLVIQVHDRSSIPEPPEFPLPDELEGAEGAQGGQRASKDDGYVCGIARMPLHDLLKGRTQVKFRVPLLPFSTIRGAASLDWATRPGNYCHAGSELKVLLRLAVPLTQTVGYQEQERVFSRAVFVMDYRDSGLFHAIEDLVRKHNAWILGFASLNPPLSTGTSLQLKQSESLPRISVRPVSKSSTRGGGMFAPDEEEDMLLPAFSSALADEALGIYEDNDGAPEDRNFGGGNPLIERRGSSVMMPGQSNAGGE